MSGETQRQDDASEGDGRAWTPPPPHETPETLKANPIETPSTGRSRRFP